MLIPLFILIVSLGVLIWSSDLFVDGASATARHLGVSPLIVGMVIIGFGTSAPEMLVSLLAAIQGNPSLALGNALGSNITNIGLILGLTALISPIVVQSGLLKRELPVLLAASVVASGLLLDGNATRLDGAIMLILFVVVMGWIIWQSREAGGDILGEEAEHLVEASELPPMRQSIIRLVAGMALLLLSSKFLVDSAVELAQLLGVSDLVIGLTIVAIGTSLPELASSLAAVRRNEHDMALGNVIGSNIFNILAVVGISSSVSPFSVEVSSVLRDAGMMLLLTGLLFVFCIGLKGRQGQINRYEAGALAVLYLGYMGYLLKSSVPAAA